MSATDRAYLRAAVPAILLVFGLAMLAAGVAIGTWLTERRQQLERDVWQGFDLERAEAAQKDTP